MDDPDFTNLPCALADITNIWVLSDKRGRYEVQARTGSADPLGVRWIVLTDFPSHTEAMNYRAKLAPAVNAARRLMGRDRTPE